MGNRPTLTLNNFADLATVKGQMTPTPVVKASAGLLMQRGTRQGMKTDFLGEYRWHKLSDSLGESLMPIDTIGSYPVYG